MKGVGSPYDDSLRIARRIATVRGICKNCGIGGLLEIGIGIDPFCS